jgi:hypothetical protein
VFCLDGLAVVGLDMLLRAGLYEAAPIDNGQQVGAGIRLLLCGMHLQRGEVYQLPSWGCSAGLFVEGRCGRLLCFLNLFWLGFWH